MGRFLRLLRVYRYVKKEARVTVAVMQVFHGHRKMSAALQRLAAQCQRTARRRGLEQKERTVGRRLYVYRTRRALLMLTLNVCVGWAEGYRCRAMGAGERVRGLRRGFGKLRVKGE